MLIVGKLLEDSQFPTIDKYLLEAANYALLWATKDAKRLRDSQNLWVFMEMKIRMWINRKPRLSPTVYNNLQSFVEFKADMHNIFIRARKDST